MIPAISPLSEYRYLERIGYTPALVGNSCAIDRHLLDNRVMNAATSAFFMLWITICITLAIPSTICYVPVASVPVIAQIFDFFLTKQIARNRALNEYMGSTIAPSIEATSYIQKNLSAAKYLVHKIGYYRVLNTRNNKGELILSPHCRNDVFKFLIYQDPQTILNFLRTADTNLIEYSLGSRIITPGYFTPCRQVAVWMNLQSDSVARMLIQHGFNINIRNKSGFTALMELAKHNPRESEMARKLVRQINLLLYCGADKMLTVLIKGKHLIARDLALDPEIRQPLSLKQRRVKFIF
jgi:hypothetical protein